MKKVTSSVTFVSTMLLESVVMFSTCPALENPENGLVDVNGNFASYTCDTGYRINTTVNFRQCDTGADCGTPTEPTGGYANYTDTTYDATLTYGCDTGYNFTSGDSSSTCTVAQTWSGTVPTCTIIDCGSLESPDNGSVALTTTTFNSTASYTCNTGYAPDGVFEVTCQTNGSWSGDQPTCTIKDCGSLSDPTNGTVTYTSTTYNSVASFQCETGFELQGSATISCQSNNTWETQPVCVIKDCGSPSQPTNGNATSSSTLFGSVVTYTCNEGYTQAGATSATCQEDENWSAGPPTCTIVDCLALEAPDNGQVNFDPGTTYLKFATYNCETGYSRNGVNLGKRANDQKALGRFMEFAYMLYWLHAA
ncbi:sushi, von Willebrand factor type A, EGF and pentraxin domain-containing protein 1-like [Mya arenaria]|uniref:sushi, von Willebrand factor type A, EGF and pentraxin domain-containing protein 1-like n=1 Tax=Mya arenaria TaxID=6604 RepID=UPI0022DEDC03|nr:sushi, von Willebrand factor type A, EGF and pentraxin domain-containing protein 1-like [Mya arenaria]